MYGATRTNFRRLHLNTKGKEPTLVSSSIMLCCSSTWSLRNAISWSSCAWSRSFKDLSFFSGGWELIFSFYADATHTVFRDNNNNHLLKKMETKQEKLHFGDYVLTMSRFSLARFFSFSSSFWIVWVKSSFLLLSSLFLSSRGLHCFSDSRTRLSWSREAIQRVMISWCAREIRLRQNRRWRDER